jgi:hypothetical protein
MKRFSGRKFSMKPNNKLLKYLGAFVLFIIGIYIVNYIFTVVMRPNMYEGLDINEVIKKYNKKESEKEGFSEGAKNKSQLSTDPDVYPNIFNYPIPHGEVICGKTTCQNGYEYKNKKCEKVNK